MTPGIGIQLWDEFGRDITSGVEQKLLTEMQEKQAGPRWSPLSTQGYMPDLAANLFLGRGSGGLQSIRMGTRKPIGLRGRP